MTIGTDAFSGDKLKSLAQVDPAVASVVDLFSIDSTIYELNDYEHASMELNPGHWYLFDMEGESRAVLLNRLFLVSSEHSIVIAADITRWDVELSNSDGRVIRIPSGKYEDAFFTTLTVNLSTQLTGAQLLDFSSVGSECVLQPLI